jgi:hypothetical protein
VIKENEVIYWDCLAVQLESLNFETVAWMGMLIFASITLFIFMLPWMIKPNSDLNCPFIKGLDH